MAEEAPKPIEWTIDDDELAISVEFNGKHYDGYLKEVEDG